MSYYTIIYPDWDYKKEFSDKSALEKAKKEIVEKMNDAWGKIYGLAFSSPTEHSHDDIEREFYNYVQLSQEEYRLFAIGSMMESEEHYNEKPSISVNKYEYNYDPKEGIRESDSSILQVRMFLIALAVSSPIEITPKELEPLGYVSDMLDELHKQLECAITEREFSKLCVKYWDTHEEG